MQYSKLTIIFPLCFEDIMSFVVYVIFYYRSKASCFSNSPSSLLTFAPASLYMFLCAINILYFHSYVSWVGLCFSFITYLYSAPTVLLGSTSGIFSPLSFWIMLFSHSLFSLLLELVLNMLIFLNVASSPLNFSCMFYLYLSVVNSPSFPQITISFFHFLVSVWSSDQPIFLFK